MPARAAAADSSRVLAFASPAPAQSQFDSWTTENGLPQNSINDIVQTRDGYLWLATYGGLVRFDGSRFVVFDRSTDGIRSQRIRRLHEDRTGTLWASTEEGMLIRYRAGRFTTFGEEHGLPAANNVRIEESEDGRLWITLVDAIVRFDGERAVAFAPTDFQHGIVKAQPPGQFMVWWSHDATGLHVLVDGQVKTYPIGDDLLGGAITNVNSDRSGNLWVRTNAARVLKVRDGRIDRYSLQDRMPSNERIGNFHADRRGNICQWRSDVVQHERWLASSPDVASFAGDRPGVAVDNLCRHQRRRCVQPPTEDQHGNQSVRIEMARFRRRQVARRRS